jgi:hypothetical protein
MKILKDLISKMEDTLNEIEFYGEKAHHLKAEHKSLADTYIKIAEIHIEVYKMLHDRAIALINEKKQNGADPPKFMLDIWDYEHEKMVREFSEARFLVEEYKKSY